MSVNGIGQNYYHNNVSTNKYNKSKAGQFYLQKQAAEASAPESARQNANVQDVYEAFKSRVPNEYVKEQNSLEDVRESETKTEIIAKPDGSRVLVMTMSIGGMETTMSLEISKPTEALNENSEQDTDNNMTCESGTDAALTDRGATISE